MTWLHVSQLQLSPLTTSIILSSNKIQIGDILVPANADPPGKMAIKMRTAIDKEYSTKVKTGSTSVVELVSYVACGGRVQARLTSKHSISQWKADIINWNGHFKTTFHGIICMNRQLTRVFTEHHKTNSWTKDRQTLMMICLYLLLNRSCYPTVRIWPRLPIMDMAQSLLDRSRLHFANLCECAVLLHQASANVVSSRPELALTSKNKVCLSTTKLAEKQTSGQRITAITAFAKSMNLRK